MGKNKNRNKMKQMKNSIKKYKKVKLLMPIQSLRSPASRPRVWKEPPVASSLGCPQPHQKSEALVHEIGPLQTKCFMKSAGQILWVVLVVCGLGAVRVEGLRRIVCVQDLFQQLPVWHALHLRILLHLCRVHLWMLCVWLRTQIDGRGVLSNCCRRSKHGLVSAGAGAGGTSSSESTSTGSRSTVPTYRSPPVPKTPLVQAVRYASARSSSFHELTLETSCRVESQALLQHHWYLRQLQNGRGWNKRVSQQ